MQDRYSNAITYDPKWDTKENRGNVAKLLKQYDTPYWSDCPCSWVDEVSALLKAIDEKYGIAKNDTGLQRGFCLKGVQKQNKAYNLKHKPKVSLSQFKEKYGSLRIYFDCDDDQISKDVDRMIDDCQVQLVNKLKYPDPIYACPTCKQKSISWTFTLEGGLSKRCFYCGAKLKNDSKTPKTNSQRKKVIKTSKRKSSK